MADKKLTYRLYPNQTQLARLEEILALHCRLYNTALEERIQAYRETGQSLSFADQCKRLTQWRSYCGALAGMNAQSEQVTLKRLNLAFEAFFRRVKSGETPGFPRFKSVHRFSGWGYKAHGDGWKLHAGRKDAKRLQHGKLYLSSVGMIEMRGMAREIGTPKTCEIMCKGGKWYASITIDCSPVRESGKRANSLDWGVNEFATQVNDLGQVKKIENRRHTKSMLPKLEELQQAFAHTQIGSKSRKHLAKVIGTIHRKTANRRKDFLHQESAKLVRDSAIIATEALVIKNMTRSARGTIENPGKNVAQKAGLNREILSTAPGTFFRMVKYKAAEANIPFQKAPTKKLKPTQTCSCCGKARKKDLNERRHDCECGADMDRDENAARVILNWCLFGTPTGQELSAARGKPQSETPSITASAV